MIPVTISLAGGVAFATVVTLVIVPCLYCIVDDFEHGRRRLAEFLSGESSSESTTPAPAES